MPYCLDDLLLGWQHFFERLKSIVRSSSGKKELLEVSIPTAAFQSSSKVLIEVAEKFNQPTLGILEAASSLTTLYQSMNGMMNAFNQTATEDVSNRISYRLVFDSQHKPSFLPIHTG